jgi:nondiscriminating glutamyl-tRNA synthetase
MDKRIRVRYAPSPTGYLHIGNARTALFNYLFAKHSGGDFIIRIEDTDLSRNVVDGEKSQLENLKWLGIHWDESVDIGGPYAPYRQTERLDIYKKYAEELLSKGLAYKCYCTPEELEADRKEQEDKGIKYPKYSGKCRHLSNQDRAFLESQGRVPSVRLAVPTNENIVFDDLVKGNMKFNSDEIGDFVIMKSDGIPTYHFAVVVDDHTMEITHILRGDDHLSNTANHILLYKALGFPIPIYAHMTLITRTVGNKKVKLSKRDKNGEKQDVFIEDFKNKGFLPEALFNFISLLGWSPEGENTIFSKDELINIFDANRLSKSPANFDRDILHNTNKEHMEKLSSDDFVSFVMPFVNKSEFAKGKDNSWKKEFILLYRNQISYGEEILNHLPFYIQDNVTYTNEMLDSLKDEKVMSIFYDVLKEMDWSVENILNAINETKRISGQKGKNLMMPIRIVTTAETNGRPLESTLYLLGKEKVMKRLENYKNKELAK